MQLTFFATNTDFLMFLPGKPDDVIIWKFKRYPIWFSRIYNMKGQMIIISGCKDLKLEIWVCRKYGKLNISWNLVRLLFNLFDLKGL